MKGLRLCLFLILLGLGSMRLCAAGEWHPGPGHRWCQLPLPPTGKTGFTGLPPAATGVVFSNQLSDAAAARNRILENGSGVALGDVDGDGWCDIYFCRLEGPNVLYRNLGHWKFSDITAQAGVACPDQYSTGAVFADVDSDGHLDLLVNSIGGGTRLFLNHGQARFKERTDAGLDRTLGSTSLALADYDGDGDLDLYVANYRTTTLKDSPPGIQPEARMVNGQIVVTPADRFTAVMPKEGGVMLLERGEPDFFYLNDGQGRFTPASWTGGLFVDEDGKPLSEPPRNWGLSVMFRDLNGDGWPDLYICNDYFMSPDELWLNEGGRRFRAAPRLAWRNMSMSSMTIDVADIDRDGWDDWFVADMLSRDHSSRHRQRANAVRMKELPPPFNELDFRPEVLRNTFHVNRGDGTWAEIAQFSGLAASDWTWSALFLDVDLDGFEDLLITNGNLHDVLDADTLKAIAGPSQEDRVVRHFKNLLRFPRIETTNLCFRNRGDLTFEEVGAVWGFNSVGISHGMATADLDNDGDLDVVVNNLNQGAGLYRNDTIAPRVAVRLRGKAPNGQGIGARIQVLGGPVPQSQSIICGGRYLSGDDPMRVFATGAATNSLTLEVTWRNGLRSLVTNARPNRLYEIAEEKSVVSSPLSVARPDSPPITDPQQRTTDNGQRTTLFQDVSALLQHTHIDEPFDDFRRQPLLPRRFSRLGPGVAWHDVDGDGWEDVVIGSGKGGALAVYRNDGHGGFTRLTNGPLGRAVSRDVTGIVGLGSLVLVGSANYEDGLTNGGSVRVYDVGRGASGESVLGPVASTGPLALGDVDGDGDLDLFVGGRVVAGRYPEPALSQWLRNEGGRFVVGQKWERLGLVSGAVFSDLDGDGDPDLVLACEWGPLKIFRNEGGHLEPWDPPVEGGKEASAFRLLPSALSTLSGWWHGVSTGDLDGDGRLDIVASNWGRNTKYQPFLAQPLRLYWGDFNGSGAFELLEAYFDPGLKKVVPWASLDVISPRLPFVQEQFASYRAYGHASVDEILGAKLPAAHQVQATTLDSMLFLNRGDHFEARPLPAEAQWAPAFGVSVADADGDGREDLFLSQNYFDVEPETSRYDAGRGLWLRGDGRGNFQAMPGQESGVKVYGQQRGCALGDYDADGRVDLVVTQNGAQTRLYRNQGAAPGLRVRLAGQPGNPAAVGATMRLKFGNGLGPAREVHAGSGYWSQDSAVQVLAAPQPPGELWVRWPGGKTSTVALPQQAREIALDANGRLTVLR